MTDMKAIVQAIAVTAELTSTSLSAAAMAQMAKDLAATHAETAILAALERCRRELTSRLTLAAVLERIDAADGRPAANEAWGVALAAFDEAATVVLNDEIAQAMDAARPVFESGDEVGARMAFRDAYERVVRERRAGGAMPRWFPSLGTDVDRRAVAIESAVARGQLARAHVAGLLPAPLTDADRERGGAIAGLLTGEAPRMPNDAEFRARIATLRASLAGATAPGQIA